LDLICDRWSLLIVRNMLLGSSKFQEFLASPENIPTNVLSSRLILLERSGLIKAILYQRHPPRFAYKLTDKAKNSLRHPRYRRLGRIQYTRLTPDLLDPPERGRLKPGSRGSAPKKSSRNNQSAAGVGLLRRAPYFSPGNRLSD
jgi:hypothetical protein